MEESYTRPPLVAREAPSTAFAVWRFRIIAFVLLVLLAGLFAYGMIKALGIGQEDPGFGGTRQAQLLISPR